MTPTRDASKSKNAFFQNNVPIMDGEAFLFTTPRSGEVWQFRMWVKEENRQVRKTLRTRNLDEAIRLGKQEYASILGLTASGKKLFGVGFRDACQQWLDYQEQRVKTGLITQGRYLTVKTQINKHIVPYLEQKDGKKAKVGSLSYNSFYDFAQFRRLKHADVKEVTIRNEHTTIGSLIKWCFRQGFLPFEKCEFEEIKIRESIRRDTFTLEEYEVLFRFMRKWVRTDPDYRTARSNMMSLKKKQFMRDLILLNANNCMRIGELRQLTWGMVSIIQRGKHFYGKYELPAKICKNRKARSFISRGGEYLKRVKTYSNFTDADNLVFCNNDDGKPLSKTELYRMWKDILENSGIENAKERNLTPYSLRHFAITSRLYSGVSHYEVAKEAGTSVQYIETHYDHLDMTKMIANASKSFRLDKDGIVKRYERSLGDE